jgi:hypothetical protein
MPDTDLKPFSVTDGKISNQAKINPKKIAPANETSVLIAQSDRKYQPKTIYGDATLAADGKLTLSESAITTVTVAAETTTEVVSEDFPSGMLKVGSDFIEATTRNVSGTIPIRSGDGKITSDALSPGGLATATVGTQTTVTQNHPNTKVIATISGTDGSGPNPASSATIPHNLGFLPSVSVVTVDGSTITPIETEVANGVNSTTITLTQTIGSLGENTDLEVRLG